MQLIQTESCCRSCWCSKPVLLLQLLLLFIVACQMAKIAAGSLNLIPSSVFFLFVQTRRIFNVCTLGSTLITVVFTYSIWLYYILVNCGHARSQGGCEPNDTNQREKTWKKQGCCMITFARKGPLPAPHSFSCSFGRKAKSRVAPVGRWVLF